MIETESGRDISTAYLTQWFHPEPVSVPVGIAKALRRRGHDVEVLTGAPNYPSGAVLPGYRALQWSHEVRDGISVRRVPLVPGHDSSARRRMTNYLSWAFSATVFGFRTLRRADVALIYSSPASAALPAMIWRRIARTPYVLLVQDIWPDSVFATGFLARGAARPIARSGLSWFCSWAYRSAAHIAVISPGAIDLLASRGVSRDKISLVYNWTDEPQDDQLDPRAARLELGLPPDAFVITYAGNLGPAQGLDVVIEAADEIRELKDVQVLLAGDGLAAADLRELVRSLGCENVTLTGPLPREKMGLVRSASDVQLVCLADDPLFRVTMPSKVQAILASGTAAIAIGAGDAATVIEESGAGWSVPAGNRTALAEAFRIARHESRDALIARGQAGRAYYRRNMSEAIGGDRLDTILRVAAGSRRSRAGKGVQ
ncbi:glycosyltransferase family 4 protein [Aeromicrobium sp.]|uniref:glycosyltransferase family 4 protein n=1 Tax=Aeromicrobium sp. TaxID=1871063 RepID=UPI003D6C59BE